jgi:hypothetical protein
MGRNLRYVENGIEFEITDSTNACAQRAVWRKRGRGSPESLCGFASFAPVRTVVKPPPAPSRRHVSRKRTTTESL